MYELIQVADNTFYIECPAKIGIYTMNEVDICLIDSGNDKSTASKILKIIQANNWNLRTIINTHSHADHIGGNAYLEEKTGCEILVPAIEEAFTHYPILEASYLYGGYPCKNLRNKFLLAKESRAEVLTKNNLPKGLEIIELDGHSFKMNGIKTSDDIIFLADSVTSEEILQKYHIPYLADVEKYLQSLEKIQNLQAKLFIPSHAEPSENIEELTKINIQKIEKIIALLLEFCKEGLSFDLLLQKIFNHYGLVMNFNQQVLVGSTIRSFLSYLYDNKRLEADFTDNILIWKTKE